jgi:hypothetical protein
VSFEEAFWALKPEAAKHGIAPSLMGAVLANAAEGGREAYDTLKQALGMRTPKTYLAAVVRRRKTDADHEVEAVERVGRPLPGDPANVPAWVLAERAQGEVVRREGKHWRWDGALFNDKGEEDGW